MAVECDVWPVEGAMRDALIEARVAGIRRVAQDILAFDLVCAEGGLLPPFDAGAHIDVHLGGGLVRQYSLCGDPWDRSRYMIAVLLEGASRGGSTAMHALSPGAALRIGAPRNGFPLAGDGGATPPAVLFAGGVGITPILSMVRELVRRGVPLDLWYCVRERARAAFWDELRALDAARADDVRLHLHADAEAGMLDLGTALACAPSGAHAYVCGPKGFIDAVLSAARRSGWDEGRLHCEYFSGAAAQAQDGDRPFELVLSRSGLRTLVPPGVTILQVLAELGVQVPSACEQGICGTCLTAVVEGVPDHRDMVLDETERASGTAILPCCSRALSDRLVLDL